MARQVRLRQKASARQGGRGLIPDTLWGRDWPWARAAPSKLTFSQVKLETTVVGVTIPEETGKNGRRGAFGRPAQRCDRDGRVPAGGANY